MIAELGHFALILAFVVALTQAFVPLIGAQKGWADWMRLSVPAAKLQLILTGGAFAALTWAFVNSDFSVRLVATNSHSLKPMLYKISGTWGNHEGSMLLWVLILAIFGAMVAWFGGNLPEALKARALAVQAMIGAAFYAFILFTSNPFERLVNPPLDGSGLNPLLQDPGLAFHPPFLYLGYVGLSMAFSFAVAALIEGRVDAAWARWVRPWTLAAWVFLTIGIALGSYWAYYELGWGGWWFWDPVENASFMPWLAAAALLHSSIVVEKRNTLKAWTILLAILAFSLSLVGTFIVRSGVITSVHAFANDPERGVFILIILLVAVGGSLALFAWRTPSMRAGGMFGLVSRESALVLNNLLLAVATAVVFIGTLMPLVREAMDGEKISVGPPFFDLAFTPFMVALAVAMPIGAMLPWKRGDLRKTLSRLWPAAALAFSLGALVWAMQNGRSAMAPVGLALAAWLVLGSMVELAERARVGQASLRESLRRLANLPRSDWGKAVAHSGLGLTIFGIAAVTAWEVEDIRTAKPGDYIPLGGYEILFEGVEQLPIGAPFKQPGCVLDNWNVLKAEGARNFTTELGRFILYRGSDEVTRMCAEKRNYPVSQMPTTEAAIDAGLTRDVYVVLGDAQVDGESWAIRAYVKPFANWIWIGALVMALGGGLSLSDRRYRVGAAARRHAPPHATPAE